jgi:serine/threonine protein phosphatase PrpC
MSNEESKSASDRLCSAAISDTGKIRQHNEDAFALLPERALFIVSDGMGGHKAGAVASKMVVEGLPPMIEQSPSAIPARQTKNISLALRDTIVDLSQQVRQKAESKAEFQGMGATVVLAYLRTSRLYVANMGDSRAYLYRNRKLEQLTEDHSVVSIMVQDGEITAEEAKTHPARSTVLRYMGMEGVVYPDVKSIKISDDDRLLLCSDGLWGMVSNEVISETLSRENDPMQACQSLVNAANEAGGRDNITVLIADFRT